MRKLIEQILKFGVVGAISFFVDYGILVFLTEVCKINYLMSAGISFSVSVLVNYVLSLTYVFHTGHKKNKIVEFVIFLIMSIGGLGINQFIMWVSVDKIGVYYLIAKIAATTVVMVYNFITRKLFLEERDTGEKDE